MSLPVAFIDGIALWAPSLPSWQEARAALRGEAGPLSPPLRRPAAQGLPPAERRRAPDTVVLALEVAAQAVAQAGVDAATLLSVFTSAQGDLGITDHVCSALARVPLVVSPTKFLNSVHNAASGCWTMGAGCMQPSTAVSAHLHSFAAGLLEALAQCAAEARPVLLVGYDIAACGALASITPSRGLLGVALVLAPERSAHSVASLAWALRPGQSAPVPLRSPVAQGLRDNAMADALPLFEALAQGGNADLALPLSARLSLQIGLAALEGQRSYSTHE